MTYSTNQCEVHCAHLRLIKEKGVLTWGWLCSSDVILILVLREIHCAALWHALKQLTHMRYAVQINN